MAGICFGAHKTIVFRARRAAPSSAAAMPAVLPVLVLECANFRCANAALRPVVAQHDEVFARIRASRSLCVDGAARAKSTMGSTLSLIRGAAVVSFAARSACTHETVVLGALRPSAMGVTACPLLTLLDIANGAIHTHHLIVRSVVLASNWFLWRPR